MTKKYLVLLTLPIIILFACSKSSSSNNGCVSTGGRPTTAEMTNLQNYITSKGIVATEDSRGFYYSIVSSGYGVTAPTSSSTVQVRYRGKLTDDTVFDSTAAGSSATFSLSGVILGWQYGVPLIRKGGSIDLYLPPSLGYGCNASGKIPGSSILIFHIDLINY
jgi:FKBP-type peptidyl-prolyl cis-trans isomerase FkpA